MTREEFLERARDKHGYKYAYDDADEIIEDEDDGVISDDIFEKLLGLVSVDINKKKRTTRRAPMEKKNKTRKMKNSHL